MTPTLEHHASLCQASADARRQGGTRHRDIAAQLGVSEGELIAAHVTSRPRASGLQARRLRAEWPRLIAALENVGTVMALTSIAAVASHE